MPPASRALFSLVWFQCTRERLCINQVRSLLSVLGMLLGYSFEPRPNSCALASAGMVMTNGLSINGCLWQGKTRLTVQTFGLWQPQRLDVIQAEIPFLLLHQEDKRRLCWQGRLQMQTVHLQCAKKVVSDSLGLVDFTIGLVNSVLSLPAWQLKFLREL